MFRIKRGAAKVALIRAARSTLTFAVVAMLHRRFFKISILLGICFVLLAHGQTPKPAYPKREFKHHDKITTETTVEDGVQTNFVLLEHSVIKVPNADRTTISLMASFQYDGKTPVKPKHIILGFFNFAPNCVLPLHPDTTFFFDGTPLNMPESFKGWRERKPDEEGVTFAFGERKGDGLCHESTALFISQKNFLRLVSSHEVEVHIGTLKFKLTETNLEALRDLASRMVL